jgi:hypothetical protein
MYYNLTLERRYFGQSKYGTWRLSKTYCDDINLCKIKEASKKKIQITYSLAVLYLKLATLVVSSSRGIK